MEITKEDFYRLRGKAYLIDDQETLIRYKRSINWIELKESVVVREVGCKYAVLRDLLEKKLSNFDYIGVDIDEATLKKIPRYNNKQFITYNVNKGLPFDNESTDYLFCLEVLEHLENPTYFFQEAKRVLRSGGILIISVPNPYCWMEILGNLFKNPDTEGHISSFTYQNINALLKFSDLDLIAIAGTYTRVPFSKRFFSDYKLIETNNILMSRSYIYVIQK